MNKFQTELFTWKCEKCGNEFQATKYKVHNRQRAGTPNYCNSCMKAYIHETKINQFNNYSDEKKAALIQKQKDTYNNKSPEEKAAYAQRTKDQLAKRTPEEWAIINKKNSEGLKRDWDKRSKEERARRTSSMQKAIQDKRANMTPEELSAVARKSYDNTSDEDKEVFRQRMIDYNKSLSYEEQLDRVNRMNEKNKMKSPEEKADIYRRSHEWYHNLSKDEKDEYSRIKKEYYDNLPDAEKQRLSDLCRGWYDNLSDEEKQQHSLAYRKWYDNLSDEEKSKLLHSQLTRSSSGNTLTNQFEYMFNKSIASKYFYYKPEVVMIGDTTHSWDYGIFDENGDLVMVVDLDGAYFHADSCDYDGIHSKEEYDEKRSLSLTKSPEVKSFIIQESKFVETFNQMIIALSMDYNLYVMSIFNELRTITFPFPSYSDTELLKSFYKLQRMDCNDKYHQDISLNTRVGDRLIQHFHKSIWHAHTNGNISPYEAWYNDELLMKCIRNRVIYQTRLNPNKILQGFNIAKIAPKVSVFSAGRAKMIISKYLSEYGTIFDPFSGFSGRMLGTVSLNKTYIGQDISSWHVQESNQLLQFLIDNGINTNFSSVIVKDVLASSGEYPCLFTCSPYGLKEQWADEEPDPRSCDDWISECLTRFKCQRYVFVVDNTEQYKEYIVDEIHNKSHFSNNTEKIVVIDK